jgi:hypothetical protein
MISTSPTPERRRLAEATAKVADWERRGPDPSERQWGTVREDNRDGGTGGEHAEDPIERGRRPARTAPR